MEAQQQAKAANAQAAAANAKLAQNDAKLREVQAAVAQGAETRAERESRAKLDQFVYAEIVKLFELGREIPTPVRERKERVVYGLVLSMASDNLKEPFTQALAIQVQAPELKREVDKAAAYFQQDAESRLAVAAVQAPAAPPGQGRNPLATLKIDLFYCEQDNDNDALRKKAEELADAMKLAGAGSWRVRSLPQSINQVPGMMVRSPQVRFNVQENEFAAAKSLSELMQREVQSRYRVSASFDTKQVRTPTPGYLSVFLCGLPKMAT